MTLPTSLIPTLDALLSSGARWLPLGVSKNYRPGPRFLRSANQAPPFIPSGVEGQAHAWFDLVVILEGRPSLDWMGEAQDFLPCSRAEVEQALQASTTVVRGVDYGSRP